MRKKIIFALMLFASFLVAACGEQKSQSQTASANSANQPRRIDIPKMTFVELGSVNCIPCRAMQPVMQSIEKKYGSQIQVVFYDVWTPAQQHYAREYNIRLIPTQVFLDPLGIEILRHEGFFAEEDIDRFLQAQGLKVLPGM